MKLSIAPLFSSSSGNSTYVGTESTAVLVDAGLPGRQLEAALKKIDKDPTGINAILVTHEHTDHIKGVGVLSRRFDIPVYANVETWAEMEHKIGGISTKNMRVFDEGDFFVGDICVTPIPLSHDAANPVGFALGALGKKVCVMTDTGKVTSKMLSYAKGAGIVLLEANHDVDMLKCGRYPYNLKMRILSGRGHLSNEDSGKTAIELVKMGVRGILLGHLSRENNFEKLAEQTVCDALVEERILPGKDVAVGVTQKYEVTGMFSL
jgi:phosphoribosyl 1,2-cyclic phosphodiesterase